MCVDLAGVDKSKIDLEVSNSRLSIRGNRIVPNYEELDETTAPETKSKVRVHMMEIDHGAFFREVELPEHVAQSKIAAHYRNGMLWIELPKK